MTDSARVQGVTNNTPPSHAAAGPRWYPLRGLPRQGQLWSWISFDVANQSFTLIINTLLFSIFFSKVVVRDPAIDDRLWAITFGSSMLATALLSPIAGAIADERAWKKEALVLTGLVCAALTAALAFIRPGQLWLAMLLYIPANLAFSIGENFLASFLPFLAPRENLGRVSGFSWACAYSAALLLLVITAAWMVLASLRDPDQWRPFFVFAGVWFLAFTIPTMLFLKEPPAPARDGPRRALLVAAFARLADSLRRTARHRDLAMLLAASLFYGTGMSVVIFFASKLADEFGFRQEQLVIFVAVITLSGIVGTLIPTWFQDRLGHKRTTLLLLALWLATTVAFALYAYAHARHVAAGRAAGAPPPGAFPTWPLWLIGNLIGFGLGSLGAANRAFVGALTPRSRSAEVFGLWGLVFKISAVLTFPFAWVKDTIGTGAALLVLTASLGVGFVLTLLVNEPRGRAAAGDAPSGE